MSLLLGLALTFANTAGQELQLTVTLKQPATVAISYAGSTTTSTGAARVHHFSPLPIFPDRAMTATIAIGSEPSRFVVVPPIDPNRLRFAVYGDTRGGPGPHRALIEAMIRAKPSLLVHTGDLAATAADAEGWRVHLESTLAFAGIPAILSLGNHDLYVPVDQRGFLDAVAQALRYWPPPADPLIQQTCAPITAYHVRVGPALFVNMDSNAPFGPGTPQRKFLEAALNDRRDARFVFVLFHHGPISAGPHGGHPDGADLAQLFADHQVTAVIAGHDHTYQRIQRGKVTYLISGGGGAPLYWRGRLESGVRAFAPVYNWVQIDLDHEKAVLEAYALDGALLDRATLGEDAEPEKGLDPRLELALLIGGALVLLIVIVTQTVKLVRTG